MARRCNVEGMQRVALDELTRDPVGRFVAGETFAHFCAAPGLWGVVLWGRPTKTHAIELGRSLVLELGPAAVPHASIIDASRLDGGDPSAFRAAERYLTQHHAALQARIGHVALIRPVGMHGAMVSGAFDVLPRPYPVQVFDDATAAFAWLGAPAVDLDAIFAEATGTSGFVARLRGYLDAHLVDVTLAAAAKTLAVSERSLQRFLGDASTTFTDEVTDARVRAARRLLADEDAPISSVAMTIGCASVQHFSTMFRKRTGESPSEYRARMRGV
jgi:AraC-like DNA-binding protein